MTEGHSWPPSESPREAEDISSQLQVGSREGAFQSLQVWCIVQILNVTFWVEAEPFGSSFPKTLLFKSMVKCTGAVIRLRSDDSWLKFNTVKWDYYLKRDPAPNLCCCPLGWDSQRFCPALHNQLGASRCVCGTLWQNQSDKFTFPCYIQSS